MYIHGQETIGTPLLFLATTQGFPLHEACMELLLALTPIHFMRSWSQSSNQSAKYYRCLLSVDAVLNDLLS